MSESRSHILRGNGNLNANGLNLSTETLTASGAASVTIPVTVCNANGGDLAITLAAGINVGQVKCFVVSDDTNNVVVTLDLIGDNTKFTMAKTASTGSVVMCMWTSGGWSILSRSSTADADTDAVAELGKVA